MGFETNRLIGIGRALALAGAWGLAATIADGAPKPGAARLDPVTVDATAPVNTLTPVLQLGAALDGTEKGETAAALTPFNIEKMQTSGVHRVTYRTRPELGIEVWHWTEDGVWSDPAHQQGYWVGNENAAPTGKVTWGYSLPRRGDTIDNANNNGYSRIDDGDPTSFWKSNPYLDRHFTGLADSRPQWIVLSFDKLTRFDAGQILWGAPFARHFLVQYWDGKDGFAEGKQVQDFPGAWRTFAHGDITVSGDPGEAPVKLADQPVASHFIRILMMDSSETGPAGSADIRDRLGYAVREVSFGVMGLDGKLADAVRHGQTRDGQTVIQVSSNDPWHRAIDRDTDTEQPGLDYVFASHLNGGLPLMVPVGTWFDTPENAAAELKYLRRRGWPVTQIELGEEADGQFIRPEDYADLYAQWAKVLHGVDPTVQLGGPSMEGALTGTWPDTGAGTSWTGRFVAELKARGALGQLGFFSFEHYVFDDVCQPLPGMLRDETDIMGNLMRQVAASGMPKDIPWVISEYGFSPFAGRAMSELPSALLSADIVGHFLTAGGNTAYMFGYPPDTPANQNFPCAGYGNMMLYEQDDDGNAKWPMPQYWAEKMMIEDWGAPSDQPHQLFTAHSVLNDPKGRPFVVAYPLKAPDGHWSLMLVNRDAVAHRAPLYFLKGGVKAPFGPGPLHVVQYSKAQYTWIDKKEESHPGKDDPPARFDVRAGQPLTLPAMSLTVVSASGPAP